jgi:hypothetical protein
VVGIGVKVFRVGGRQKRGEQRQKTADGIWLYAPKSNVVKQRAFVQVGQRGHVSNAPLSREDKEGMKRIGSLTWRHDFFLIKVTTSTVGKPQAPWRRLFGLVYLAGNICRAHLACLVHVRHCLGDMLVLNLHTLQWAKSGDRKGWERH